MNKYQEDAIKTAVYPEEHALAYLSLGLNGEAGEVAEIIKKMLRRGNTHPSEEEIEKLIKEMGDVLWYLANLANELNLSLQEVGDVNITKLQKRQVDGTLKSR